MTTKDAAPRIPVTIARDGGHVTVSFDIPPGLDDEWAGQLMLAVNSAVGPPAARVYDLYRQRGVGGEIERRLRTSGGHDVRAKRGDHGAVVRAQPRTWHP